MKCLRCDASVDLAKPTCPSCGVALDADGDGVPDVLDRMIEKKARAMIEAEKREAQAAEEMRAAKVRAEEAEKERKGDESSLALYRRVLERSHDTHIGAWHLPGWAALGLLTAAVVIGGVIMPACVEPMMERSIVAASWVCPTKCPSCRGPGRIFTWHESSGSSEGNVSTQLCHNDAVDIDRLHWMAVSNEEEGRLAPYVLSSWWSVPIDSALVALVLFLVGPFVVAKYARIAQTQEQSDMERRIAELERKLGPPPSPPTGYRG